MTELNILGQRAQRASRKLAVLRAPEKNRALIAMAEAVQAAQEDILAANRADIDAARSKGTPEPLIDRLALNPGRIAGMTQGMREVAELADPVGRVLSGGTLDNGLRIEQRSVPFGVIGIIYEARPDVTADAAALCVKGGIAGILRGSGMAGDANVVIFDRFREELKDGRTPLNAVKFGFRNAGRAVLDSNVTTLIAAVVLMIFGTGTIKGFATTLLISVLASLFTAVVVTRWLLNLICRLDIRKRSAYTR